MIESGGSIQRDPWAGADRIDAAAAQRWVLDRTATLEPRSVSLSDAVGLVLACDVVALEASPRFDTAAMDGYAVGAAEPASSFAVVGVSVAGHPFAGSLGADQSVRIMTGAVVPPGTEVVVPLEQATFSSGRVVVSGRLRRGANIRRAGEDHRPGDVVASRGTRLQPAHIALLAAMGQVRPSVVPRVRVGVLSTGDELDGEPSSAGIRDANRPGLLALVDAAGHIGVDLGSVADDAESLERRIVDSIERCDIVITTGGVSVGDHDDVKHVLARVAARSGGESRWMHVAVRPAKPLMVAIVSGVPVLGLPGNPASALVSFELFARPALDRLAGRVGDGLFAAVASAPFHRESDGRLHVVPGMVSVSGAGVLTVQPVTGLRHGLEATAAANAHAFVPDGDGVATGGMVECSWTVPTAFAP